LLHTSHIALSVRDSVAGGVNYSFIHQPFHAGFYNYAIKTSETSPFRGYWYDAA
jgi:hypothetical protein